MGVGEERARETRRGFVLFRKNDFPYSIWNLVEAVTRQPDWKERETCSVGYESPYQKSLKRPREFTCSALTYSTN